MRSSKLKPAADAPLRIGLVAPVAPPYGGMALQAKLLARLLAEDGHAVVFSATNFPLPGILERIPGVRTVCRALAIYPKLWFDFANVDVVHVFAASWWFFFLAVYPAAIVARLRGARLIVNYRGGAAAAFFETYGWAAAPVFRLAAEVTAPSGFLARILCDRFGKPVSIVPNILDGKLFAFRERTSFCPALVVNRHLEKIYDIESVLRAFGAVQARYPEATLSIAGSGPEEKRLRDLASELQLREARFLGRLTHAELAVVYEQCDILINASRIDNFPGALIEASGAGLLVVSTNAGGIPSIYTHEESALLVEVGDWRSLAEQVVRAVENGEWAARVVRGALEMVRSCAWSEVRRPLYAAYRGEERTGPAVRQPDLLTRKEING